MSHPDGYPTKPDAPRSLLPLDRQDVINRPPHYTQGKIECIDAIDAATEGLNGTAAFYVAQVMKYIWRHQHKNGVEDLKKARWYLDRLISKAGP